MPLRVPTGRSSTNPRIGSSDGAEGPVRRIRGEAARAQEPALRLGAAASQALGAIGAVQEQARKDQQDIENGNALNAYGIALGEAAASESARVENTSIANEDAFNAATQETTAKIQGVPFPGGVTPDITARMEQARAEMTSKAGIFLRDKRQSDGIIQANQNIQTFGNNMNANINDDPRLVWSEIDNFNSAVDTTGAPETIAAEKKRLGAIDAVENAVETLTARGRWDEAEALLDDKRTDDILTGDDRSRLSGALDRSRRVANDAAAVKLEENKRILGALLPNGDAIGPDDRAGMNRVYDKQFAGEVEALRRSDPDAFYERIQFLTSKWGMVPNGIKRHILGPLRQPDSAPEAVAEAAKILHLITNGQDPVMDEFSGDKSETQLATSVTDLMSDRIGMSARDAVSESRKNIAAAADTGVANIRAGRLKEEKKTKPHADWLKDSIGRSDWSFWPPSLGTKLAIPDEMQAAFNMLVDDHFMRTDSIGGARDWARAQLQTTWGQNHTDDNPRWQRNSPSSVYRQMNVNIPPETLREEYSSSMPTAIVGYSDNPEAFRLEIDPLTFGPNAKEGAVPEWFIMSTNKFGVIDYIWGEAEDGTIKQAKWSSPSFDASGAQEANVKARANDVQRDKVKAEAKQLKAEAEEEISEADASSFLAFPSPHKKESKVRTDLRMMRRTAGNVLDLMGEQFDEGSSGIGGFLDRAFTPIGEAIGSGASAVADIARAQIDRDKAEFGMNMMLEQVAKGEEN